MSAQLADHFVDVLSPLGAVSARKMFGANCLFIDGKAFAVVDDGALFLKTNKDLRDELVAGGGTPFTYFHKAKGTRVEMSYCSPPDGVVDDTRELLKLAKRSVAIALTDKAAAKKAKPAAKKAKPAAKKVAKKKTKKSR